MSSPIDQPSQVDVRVACDDLLHHVQRRAVSPFENVGKAGTLDADLVGKGGGGEAEELDSLVNALLDGRNSQKQAGD